MSACNERVSCGGLPHQAYATAARPGRAAEVCWLTWEAAMPFRASMPKPEDSIRSASRRLKDRLPGPPLPG